MNVSLQGDASSAPVGSTNSSVVRYVPETL